MLAIRKSDDRGQIDHGWLYARHSFSFGHYYDPKQMGFRSLRVINEDTVQPGQGFGTHPHRDMEIVTYVLEGALEHKDSMGNGSVLRPGMMQRMTAGTGVTHSEFNHSPKEPVHLLQIWLIPAERGLKPGYEEKDYSAEIDAGLRLVVSPDARGGSLKVHQDVLLHAGRLKAGAEHDFEFAGPHRHAWIQVARGGAMVSGANDSVQLAQGDGLAVSDENALKLTAGPDGAELLVFDLA